MTEPKTTLVLLRKFIKPSTKTPPNLKTLELSLLDQMTPDLHFNTTFFYLHSKSSDDRIVADPIPNSEKSQQLQNSLSRTLNHFYPYAGRFKDYSTVDCNDDGILFIEAHSNFSLAKFLHSPNLSIVDKDFLPSIDSAEINESFQGPMLLIKFISFSCGGCAVSFSISHKIADMVSLSTFLQNLSLECHAIPSQLLPDFSICPSLLPARDIPTVKTNAIISPKKFATIRLVFHASRIGKLKAKIYNALNNDGKKSFHPSTVEVVEALICKCVMAACNSKKGSFSPSVLVQAVNLRTRMNPPQPQIAMGNLMWMYPIIVKTESEMEMVDLVKKLRSMKDSLKDKATNFNSEEILGVVQQFFQDREEQLQVLEPCIFSSWCKFPLLEIDLGWGKPVWVTSIAKNLMTNTVYLMDTKEAGAVEALVHLDEEEMNSFGVNEELLRYAAVNPSVI